MNVQKMALWAAMVPLFLIPFLALYVANSHYFPFITGKHFVFRALVEIAVAGWVVLAIADRRYRPRFSLVLLAFGLLVAWMAVADVLAVNSHKAIWSNFERMDGWVTLVHVFFLFVVAGSVLTASNLWRKWWLTFVASSALVSLYGLLQFFGATKHELSGNRIDATLGNAEYMAGYLLFAIAATLWLAFEKRTQKSLRYGLIGLAVLHILILLGTGTRGTLVALVGAAAFGSIAWMFEAGKKGRRGALVVLVVLGVAVGGLFAARNSAYVEAHPTLDRFASIFDLRKELGTRLTIWSMAVEGAKERPVIGWGHEGYNYIFNAKYRPSLYGQEPWFDRAHNIYLDWLVAGGIPALLLFLFLGASAIYVVYRSKELSAAERVLLLSAFVGYGIQGLVVFDNLFTYVPLAFLLAYAHARQTRSIGFLERLAEARGTKLELVAGPAAVVAALIVIYMVNMPTYMAGKELIKALSPQTAAEARLGYFKSALAREPFATQEIREQLLNFAQSVEGSNASSAFKAETLAFAASQMQQEIERAPRDARLHVLSASFLRNVGKYDEARIASARARELSPNKPTIILEQGLVELQAKDPKAAVGFFEEASALAPQSEEAALYAGAGRIIAGDLTGGKALLAQRFGTSTLNHIVLAVAYQEARSWNDLIAVLQLRYAQTKDATTGYQIAMAYAQAGRFAEARAQTRAIMTAHPESASRGTALLLQLDQRVR
jgi:O-antigen ligase